MYEYALYNTVFNYPYRHYKITQRRSIPKERPSPTAMTLVISLPH